MLTDIVSKIEQGEIPLQDSIEQYERGMSLIKHCREILEKAEKRIDKITKEQESKKQ
jgi:exodeoxyribonuclease VII small subunit